MADVIPQPISKIIGDLIGRIVAARAGPAGSRGHCGNYQARYPLTADLRRRHPVDNPPLYRQVTNLAGAW